MQPDPLLQLLRARLRHDTANAMVVLEAACCLYCFSASSCPWVSAFWEYSLSVCCVLPAPAVGHAAMLDRTTGLVKTILYSSKQRTESISLGCDALTSVEHRSGRCHAARKCHNVRSVECWPCSSASMRCISNPQENEPLLSPHDLRRPCRASGARSGSQKPSEALPVGVSWPLFCAETKAPLLWNACV